MRKKYFVKINGLFEIIVWRLKCVVSSKMVMKKKMEIIFSDMDCIGIRWDSFYCIVDKLF